MGSDSRGGPSKLVDRANAGLGSDKVKDGGFWKDKGMTYV